MKPDASKEHRAYAPLEEQRAKINTKKKEVLPLDAFKTKSLLHAESLH